MDPHIEWAKQLARFDRIWMATDREIGRRWDRIPKGERITAHVQIGRRILERERDQTGQMVVTKEQPIYAFTEEQLAAHWEDRIEWARQHRLATDKLEAKRDEMLADLRAQKAAEIAQEMAAGIAEIRAHHEAAYEQMQEMRRRIRTTPARTVAGLMIQFRELYQWEWADCPRKDSDDYETVMVRTIGRTLQNLGYWKAPRRPGHPDIEGWIVRALDAGIGWWLREDGKLFRWHPEPCLRRGIRKAWAKLSKFYDRWRIAIDARCKQLCEENGGKLFDAALVKANDRE